jgi:hypothetical protein
MIPGFNAESSQPFAVRNKQDAQHNIPNPRLAADGFNIWWQKTFAQHTAMAAEASTLMPRRVSSAGQACSGQIH